MEKLHQVTHSGDEASKQTWFGVQAELPGRLHGVCFEDGKIREKTWKNSRWILGWHGWLWYIVDVQKKIGKPL